jgi:hypothetical protein
VHDVTDGTTATLRGAPVRADVRVVLRVLGAIVLSGVVALIAALAVSGASRNAQLDRLHHDGLAMRASVVSCRTLLAGSGSNGAGTECDAAYRVDGHRYVGTLPGDTPRAPGSSVAIVVAATDPSLLTTPRILREEASSWRVFLAPGVLSIALLAALGALAASARRRRDAPVGADVRATAEQGEPALAGTAR